MIEIDVRRVRDAIAGVLSRFADEKGANVPVSSRAGLYYTYDTATKFDMQSAEAPNVGTVEWDYEFLEDVENSEHDEFEPVILLDKIGWLLRYFAWTLVETGVSDASRRKDDGISLDVAKVARTARRLFWEAERQIGATLIWPANAQHKVLPLRARFDLDHEAVPADTGSIASDYATLLQFLDEPSDVSLLDALEAGAALCRVVSYVAIERD